MDNNHNLTNLFLSQASKRDWKEDWREDTRADWRWDWKSVAALDDSGCPLLTDDGIILELD